MLIAEGTYPFAMGGVSTWCDQLIRGLQDFEFKVIALTVNGLEKAVYPPPPNLKGVINFPLWRMEGARCSRSRSRAPRWFDQVHQDFVSMLIQPKGNENHFLWTLHAMAEYAQQGDLREALLSEAALERLMRIWKEHQYLGWLTREHPHQDASGVPLPELTLHDALIAFELIDHLLRPLRFIPPKADVYHAVSNGPAALVGMMGKWHHRAPFILTEHGVYLRERYLEFLHSPYSSSVQLLVLNFFHLVTSAAYQMADLILPVAGFNRRWEERGGAPSSSIRVVHNGVDPEVFTPPETEPEVPTLTFVGRIDPIKDLCTLVGAFTHIKERIPNARLRIFGPTPAGNGAYREMCEMAIRKLGLEGATFEGPISSPVRGYQSGHVVVVSSISEGFPYVVVEAMACGRAVVATDVGGVAEAVGDAGILVPARDPEAMGKACTELLLDDERRRALGKAARARVLEHFTIERFLNDYRNIYWDVAVGTGLPLFRQVSSWAAGQTVESIPASDQPFLNYLNHRGTPPYRVICNKSPFQRSK
ncbi:MAG: GT4 family glycosyltransferase PelF [Anaerolineae bacterium]